MSSSHRDPQGDLRSFINTDVAEGAGVDEQLIPLVGAANICCGAHAGGVEEMRATISACVTHGVKMGAHPGYPDPENLGRKEMIISLEDLRESLLTQLNTLEKLVTEAGGEVRYIKPHGALYNRMARDYDFSCEMMEILTYWRPLPVVVLAQSEAEEAGRDLGLPTISEGFMDRGYTDDRKLVPRTEPGALITDADLAYKQALALLKGTEFPSVSGKALQLKVETVCVHGDSVNALEILEQF